MNILIVEAASHYKVLESVNFLIQRNCCNAKISYLVNYKELDIRDKLFPNYNSVNWIISKMHISFLFLKFIFIGRKYDLINISTGPEGDHFSMNISVIFFYIASLLYGKKIILTIKNIRPYLINGLSFKHFVRNASLKNFKGITFESETMRDVFHNETNLSKENLSVIYDRYIDNKEVSNEKSKYNKNSKIIIGLAGQLESIRRNYIVLIDALKLLTSAERSKISFISLGRVPNGKNNYIVDIINKLVDINVTKGFITAKEFQIRGNACDILISPLKKEFEYGTYKGSGTWGDAVYLKKKMIVPSFCDPMKEFQKTFLYYDGSKSLADILRNLNKKELMSVDDKYYDKFLSYNVYSKLKQIHKL